MPTTRKRKKTRKSRGLEVLSDIENLDIMLGGNPYNGTERERSLDNNSIERRGSVISNNLDNEGESLFSNCRNDEPRTSADFGQNSAEANSLAEGWEVPVERPEINAEEQQVLNATAGCRNEQCDGYRTNGPSTRNVHDRAKKI